MIRALDAFLAVRMPVCRPKTEVGSSSGPSPDLGFTVNSMDTCLALNDRRHWRSQSPLQRYSKVNRAPGETPGTSLTLGDHPYARQWLIEARGERRTAPTTRRTDSLLILVLGLRLPENLR